ncbi:sigma-24, ECF subfamily [Candidatus Koribacter versatilis Ellin345]|uniref:Sigma-24, ECF subfamily n=1 Tax=Koribacter versatilis (strain Ellin345) TaxID=204669 RepID=Q1IHG2_KORVE|nr:sigma-70 family RNA polymerase sigma factor [Candidatus Koribacter versatilis]ABF43688.1 sigma-24, ECF subfamily [Candidatus Koribacter versatilis Ellin345]
MESHERVREFDRVVTPHLARAYNLAHLIVGNSADAEDLVQEASLRAFRGLDGYHGGDARTWLLVIVRNVCYSFLSRTRNVQEVVEFEEEQHSGESATPEASVLQTADAADVRRAIEELPTEFREALVLREMEELSYKQIAEITGAPVGTVMSRLSRARQQLRQRLQKQAGKGA